MILRSAKRAPTPHDSQNYSSVSPSAFEDGLELSALLIGLVNGLWLLKFNWRDKPKLRAEPIHPDIYQWWFRLPDGEFQGHPTRAYGFIAYVGIVNRGLRKVSLDSWRLFINGPQTRLFELRAYNMPEITVPIGTHIKKFPSLGQRTLSFEADSAVDSGASTSGMVYYVYECWGDSVWDPAIRDGKITGKFVITDAFKNTSTCSIEFSERPLNEIKKIADGVEHLR